MIITGVGVFIPVAVLIVAPIALSVGKQSNWSKVALLVALSGGGKAGNVISPNPNTIAAANGFHEQLSTVMMGAFIPAILGLVVAVLLAHLIRNKGDKVQISDLEDATDRQLMPIGRALIAPVLAILLLMMNPIANVLGISYLAKLNIDAMYILPFASVVGAIFMGHAKKITFYASSGIKRVMDTVLILIGAGALAGLISNSDLAVQVVNLIQSVGISGKFLAPISGALMSLAVASTSTAVIVATQSFGDAIVQTGLSGLAAAVMFHTGATMLDAMPQGNYFHITGQAMKMSIKERMKVMPYEAIVGGTMTVVATILYGFVW